MKCGECTVCCEIVEVSGDNFFKAAGKMCQHCDGGCMIYDKEERPQVCNSFKCMWLHGFGLPTDRPDKNNIMVSISKFNGGTWMFVMETVKDAYRTTGKPLILELTSTFNIPVIVSSFDSKPGEDYGDFVILKASLEARAKMLKGDFKEEYTDGVNVYKLNR